LYCRAGQRKTAWKEFTNNKGKGKGFPVYFTKSNSDSGGTAPPCLHEFTK